VAVAVVLYFTSTDDIGIPSLRNSYRDIGSGTAIVQTHLSTSGKKV
jgi:hypothetical protein